MIQKISIQEWTITTWYLTTESSSAGHIFQQDGEKTLECLQKELQKIIWETEKYCIEKTNKKSQKSIYISKKTTFISV